ncbi:cell death regulator Aven [Sceloporus undulatus]|uniref:cell death regulator Aven n=1 Tax=Sceloporus undulatus TaxID=8520 RepID=UPI001C4C3A05|nr:cell death regulator Aven [Sceloporus undulatus]
MATMQPERGDRPRRGGGGNRQNRRRPGGRERQAEGRGGRPEDGQQRGGGGGGGGSRGRGQGRRGRGASSSSSAPPSSPQGNESAADDLELQGKELGSYSCRKVVSNWHRYEDTEKETQNDSGESQRGTDFSVLLSSAGDSFTQFRFAEEKEWIVENLCPKQLSGLYVDCQSLVQALEELPLHLRLNVAAELVQDATPAILPQIKLKGNDVPKKSGGELKQPLGQSTNPSGSYPAADSAAHLKGPNKDGLNSEALQKSPSSLFQETDNLDEDLDLLLKLDAPVNPENNFELETLCPGTASGEDMKMPHEENDCLQLDGTEEICSAAQQEVTSKSITEEELEDWLDSMIS